MLTSVDGSMRSMIRSHEILDKFSEWTCVHVYRCVQVCSMLDGRRHMRVTAVYKRLHQVVSSVQRLQLLMLDSVAKMSTS